MTVDPTQHRQYEFSHWSALPIVSCQCITYGRPQCLNEAVESFLRQDYLGLKELVILNDHPDVLVENPGIPGVKVVNSPTRFRSIGDKRNVCCGLCRGDIIVPWDDDDISLPWRLSVSVSRMTNHDYFKPDRLWTWKNGGVEERRTSLAHAMGAWSRRLFDLVGGYPSMESGQDQVIESRFAKTGKRRLESIVNSDIFYIYRSDDTSTYHLSDYGWNNGMQEAAEFVKLNVQPGRYELRPTWQLDYVNIVRSQQVRDCGASIGSQPSSESRRPQDSRSRRSPSGMEHGT